jgi:hypothetical protein
MAICALFHLAGCGRKETAPPTEGGENSPASSGAKPAGLPLDQQIEQKLDPLTKEDVELYLKVMRAAADRVQNPAPADRIALEDAKKILAGSASGRVPTPSDVKTLERANLVAMAMDQIIADEMKLDGRTYRGIAEAVESVVPNPALGLAPSKDVPPTPEHVLTPLEKRLSDVNTANETFLIPYRAEIQKLMAVVRNPANLPK